MSRSRPRATGYGRWRPSSRGARTPDELRIPVAALVSAARARRDRGLLPARTPACEPRGALVVEPADAEHGPEQAGLAPLRPARAVPDRARSPAGRLRPAAGHGRRPARG